MNIIKVFTGCSFIGAFDDVTVVFCVQYRPLFAVQNRLVAGVFIL